MLALEAGPLLAPEELDHAAGFLESRDPLSDRAELEAEHRVLALRPRSAEAELEPAAREVIDGDGHLRQNARMAIGVAGDHATDAPPARRLGHRSEERPGLEDVAGRVGADRGEMVEVPAVVEAGLVGDAPYRPQLVDGRKLRRQLQPDTHPGHAANATGGGMPGLVSAPEALAKIG